MKKELIIVAVGVLIMMGLAYYWGFRSANRDARLKQADQRIEYFKKEADRWQDSSKKHLGHALVLEQEVALLGKENDSLWINRSVNVTRITHIPVPRYKRRQLDSVWHAVYSAELK